MDAHVDPAIARKEGPEVEHPADPTPLFTQHSRQKSSYAKRVGGMGRDKAVSSSR